MFGRRVGEPQFVVVRRGYDPDQVDAYLAEYGSWGKEAWARIQYLEAKLADLEARRDTSQRDRDDAERLVSEASAHAVEAEQRAAELLAAAETRARELAEAAQRARDEAELLVKQASEEKLEARRRAVEMLDEARTRVTELWQSKSGQDQGAHEAGHDVDRFVWPVDVTPADRDRDSPASDGDRTEVEHLREEFETLDQQRRWVIGEFARIRDSLDTVTDTDERLGRPPSG